MFHCAILERITEECRPNEGHLINENLCICISRCSFLKCTLNIMFKERTGRKELGVHKLMDKKEGFRQRRRTAISKSKVEGTEATMSRRTSTVQESNSAFLYLPYFSDLSLRRKIGRSIYVRSCYNRKSKSCRNRLKLQIYGYKTLKVSINRVELFAVHGRSSSYDMVVEEEETTTGK